MITWSFFRTWTCCFVNQASKPLSQNWLVEMRALMWRFENTLARQASMGKSGKSMSAVWVDWMTVQSGSLTRIPLMVGRLSAKWLSIFRKWLVQPEPA